MEIQMDVLIIWNSLCISLSTFYLVFKFRRDFGKLKEDIGEIKRIVIEMDQEKILVAEGLEFLDSEEKGQHATD